jgi:hypothetical protein
VINQFFWLRFIRPGDTQELPSTTNWMKLWRYITLELNQTSTWFIPSFKEEIFAKVFQKRWSKGYMDRILKRDYVFYKFDDFNTIITTLHSDFEELKRDWLIIKNTPTFTDCYWDQIHDLAKDLETRVVIIGKQ